MAQARPAASPPRYGSTEPRIFTPPLRELTPDTSLGYAVIEFATEVIKINLHPYQRWLYIHALELLGDGSLRFRVIIVLIARQNGKSTWSQILALFFMFVLGRALVIGTAQDLDMAEEIWQGAVEMVEGNEELNDQKKTVVRTNGKKSLELKSGERWKVKAASRRAGRGLSGDLVLLDELREHQTWDAWSAVTKTTMARPDALIGALSNAGDASSVVLRWLRNMAHEALGDPDRLGDNDVMPELLDSEADEEENLSRDLGDLLEDDSLGIFEWSAPPGCSIIDRSGWAHANPAMGYTITERTIASAAHTDPEWVFRTEVLCQWSEGGLAGPFPAGAWEACAVELDAHNQPAPADRMLPDERTVACLDVAWDRSASYIGICGRRRDGLAQVELVARRPGTDWIIAWLLDPRFPHRAEWPMVLNSGSPAWALADPLTDAGITVVKWQGRDVGVGCAQLYDAVKDRQVRHLDQPVLNVPAATASIRPLGNDSWTWDRRRSAQDCSPLIAATGAHWLFGKHSEPPPPPPMPVTAAPGTIPQHELSIVGF